MAKHLYSQEEASAKLSKNAEELKALVREGKLREFRDAGKVFYKAEDVDKLSGGGSKDDTGEIMLEAAEDELPSLADMSSDTGGGTSVIGLAPSGDEDKQKAKKEGTVISASGIGVFDDDELEIDADPMAKTQITSSAGGDAVSLEGTGGGSGLMDLTRESDDTSLGAELLDDIYPGEEDAAPAKAPPARSKASVKETAPMARETAAEPEPMVPMSYAAAAGDPIEPVLTGVMAGSLLVLAISGSVAAGVMQGYVPDYGKYLSNNLLIFVGIALGLPLIAAGVGFALGRRR